MTLLFTVAVLIGFVLWFMSALPGTRVPEWSARLAFLVASVIWCVPALGGVG